MGQEINGRLLVHNNQMLRERFGGLVSHENILAANIAL